MKIEVGKYYRTRGGNKAYIAGEYCNGGYGRRFAGQIGELYVPYTIDGGDLDTQYEDSDDDIIAPWQDEPKEIEKLSVSSHAFGYDYTLELKSKLNELVEAVNELRRK